jgi:hypothetical protein
MFNEKARQLWLEARTVGNLVKPAGGALFRCPELIDKGLHGSRRAIGTCESCEDQPRLLPEIIEIDQLVRQVRTGRRAPRRSLPANSNSRLSSENMFASIRCIPGQEAQSFSVVARS